ncbi:GbsR/MarR family transcriptional regulator [Haloarcula litorea]|uniref:GbsR/MarR family transcriptional regulator n=1 Tax=Haloarcula litorea TaxID=3032579 RepID=UPI0023E8F72F|nr:helix-turn-helix domain-containing protein [Halomicroarcula sp. GDY20]
MSDTEDPIESARETVIAAMERSAETYGMNRSYGQLYGILFFADDPVSLDELVAASGYAKSTVSSAMQSLERLHLVHRRSIPGEGKKAFYEAERDFWTVLQELLRREVQYEIDTMTSALAEAEETLSDADSEQAERDLEKIRQLERMYEHSDRIVSLLTSTSIDRLAGVVDRLRGE